MIDFTQLKLNNDEPVYIQLAMYVKKQIVNGSVSSGEEFPSRRELAAMLDINPNTVQKAYRHMEDAGFVYTESSKGSFLLLDSATCETIKKELTEEMVRDFIRKAKGIKLSFKDTMDLVSKGWEEV